MSRNLFKRPELSPLSPVALLGLIAKQPVTSDALGLQDSKDSSAFPALVSPAQP